MSPCAQICTSTCAKPHIHTWIHTPRTHEKPKKWLNSWINKMILRETKKMWNYAKPLCFFFFFSHLRYMLRSSRSSETGHCITLKNRETENRRISPSVSSVLTFMPVNISQSRNKFLLNICESKWEDSYQPPKEAVTVQPDFINACTHLFIQLSFLWNATHRNF